MEGKDGPVDWIENFHSDSWEDLKSHFGSETGNFGTIL
jgi:hypothetical protein